MSKRSVEPDEALGPQVDGLEDWNFPPVSPEATEEMEEDAEQELEEEVIVQPVFLLCGDGEDVEECSKLAASCGFEIQLVKKKPDEDLSPESSEPNLVHIVPDYDDFVEKCGIDRNYFVGIFVDDLDDCAHILRQCLDSDARYLGALGAHVKRAELFSTLKAMGAPDAELAAICCPMGLNVGANTAAQRAVAIVAQILAAKAGSLARLRQDS